jgi:5,10-methylenetetrahydrofolate reductase
MSKIASAFLIPDNHIGRATVSSIAVAYEVGLMGGRSIACLNARDRNLLGFRRDLLTAAAYGVDKFLLVYGDRPEVGTRSGGLTVREMITEARDFNERHAGRTSPFQLGVASGLRALPAWKQTADMLFAQVSFNVADLCEWRASIDFGKPVYAGVMVVAGAPMARKLGHDIPQLAVPPRVIDAVERDHSAGVKIACELIEEIKASKMFDGAHLIPISRYREIATALEAQA